MTAERYVTKGRVVGLRTPDHAVRAEGDGLAVAASAEPSADYLALLAVAKERSKNPDVFDRNPPVFFDVIPSRNALDAYSTVMGDSTLKNFAEDAANGVAVLDSHNSRELGFGRSLTGKFIRDGEERRVESAFFTMPGIVTSGMSTDAYIRGIESGIWNDISVGFNMPPDAAMVCSICGGNMLDWESCPHFAGLAYEQEGSNSRRKEVAIGTIERARLNEYSLVYDGATPGAAVAKALRMAAEGMVEPKTIERLERAYGRSFPAPRSWAGGVTRSVAGDAGPAAVVAAPAPQLIRLEISAAGGIQSVPVVEPVLATAESSSGGDATGAPGQGAPLTEPVTAPDWMPPAEPVAAPPSGEQPQPHIPAGDPVSAPDWVPDPVVPAPVEDGAGGAPDIAPTQPVSAPDWQETAPPSVSTTTAAAPSDPLPSEGAAAPPVGAGPAATTAATPAPVRAVGSQLTPGDPAGDTMRDQILNALHDHSKVRVRASATDDEIVELFTGLLTGLNADLESATGRATEMQSTIDTLTTEKSALAAEAEDGRAYRTATVNAAIDALVRSLPEDKRSAFKRESHEAYLRALPIEDIIAMHGDWDSRSQFAAGRQSSEVTVPVAPGQAPAPVAGQNPIDLQRARIRAPRIRD